MKVLVLLEVGADVRVPPDCDPRSGRVRAERLVWELDPASARALSLALRLKVDEPGLEITALHLGPAWGEPWLREALAQGSDRAVRVWSEEIGVVRAAGKAVILAAAAQAAGFDVVLVGAAGVLNADGQLGVLLAAHLGVPCVTQSVGLSLSAGTAAAGRAQITRGLDRGYRERVEVSLPVVVTVSSGASEETPPHIPVAARLKSQTCQIQTWDLGDLGVPLEQVRVADQALRYGRPRPPRPRLHPIAAPDSTLPAFDRILKLVQGSVKRREGRIVRESAESTVAQIFDALRDEGWLDHLRPGGAESQAASSPETRAGT